MRVISLVPQDKFKQAGIEVPPDLSLEFCLETGSAGIIGRARRAEVLLCPPSFPRIGSEVIENLPLLGFIQSSGAGYDGIDYQAAARRGVPVANSPGENASTVAEYVFAAIIALQRRLLTADQSVKSGNFREVKESLLNQGLGEVRDSSLGIVGLGNIGKEVARIGNCLGAHVYYHSRARRALAEEERLAVTYLDLDSLLKTSDTVVVQVALSQQTRGYIGERELSLLKPGAILINAARGGIVDERALAAALEKGAILGAAVDVFEGEVPKAENPLLNLSPDARGRLLLTPHVAGLSKPAFARMLRQALQNIGRVTGGTPPLFVVNGVERR